MLRTFPDNLQEYNDHILTFTVLPYFRLIYRPQLSGSTFGAYARQQMKCGVDNASRGYFELKHGML